MVVALSYLLAVVITVFLAIILYPIAGLFWVLGFFGRIADSMFSFTSKMISSLWRDIRKVNAHPESVVVNQANEEQNTEWQCACGATNTTHFCTKCGRQR